MNANPPTNQMLNDEIKIKKIRLIYQTLDSNHKSGIITCKESQIIKSNPYQTN
jgi:hypothetical protein